MGHEFPMIEIANWRAMTSPRVHRRLGFQGICRTAEFSISPDIFKKVLRDAKIEEPSRSGNPLQGNALANGGHVNRDHGDRI